MQNYNQSLGCAMCISSDTYKNMGPYNLKTFPNLSSNRQATERKNLRSQ